MVNKKTFSLSSALCLNLVFPNITPWGLFSGGGGLFMEGVFHFKSWFLNISGLIHSGAYYRNLTVCCIIWVNISFTNRFLS